jgi:hypothetical protein
MPFGLGANERVLTRMDRQALDTRFEMEESWRVRDCGVVEVLENEEGEGRKSR